jgi:hypothetical protein
MLLEQRIDFTHKLVNKYYIYILRKLSFHLFCDTKPSDTLLRYFNMFHPAPSPSSLQFIKPSVFPIIFVNQFNCITNTG